MSYERLQVTDHVDKWDAAKLKHVEDGIVSNEEAIDSFLDEFTNDNALTLLIETGLVNPIVNLDDSIIISSDKSIYIL